MVMRTRLCYVICVLPLLLAASTAANNQYRGADWNPWTQSVRVLLQWTVGVFTVQWLTSWAVYLRNLSSCIVCNPSAEPEISCLWFLSQSWPSHPISLGFSLIFSFLLFRLPSGLLSWGVLSKILYVFLISFACYMLCHPIQLIRCRL
jgi:hypothetical protein